MSPYLIILGSFAVLHVLRVDRWPGGPGAWEKAATALGVSLIAAGVLHFVMPAPFRAMVPPFVPAPHTIVFVSGIVELGVGMALLVPRLRRRAGWAAAVLFLAIWPGSIHTAFSGSYPPGMPATPLYHWLRVPFHVLYVLWAVWVGRGRMPFLDRRRPVECGPAAARS